MRCFHVCVASILLAMSGTALVSRKHCIMCVVESDTLNETRHWCVGMAHIAILDVPVLSVSSHGRIMSMAGHATGRTFAFRPWRENIRYESQNSRQGPRCGFRSAGLCQFGLTLGFSNDVAASRQHIQ